MRCNKHHKIMVVFRLNARYKLIKGNNRVICSSCLSELVDKSDSLQEEIWEEEDNE